MAAPMPERSWCVVAQRSARDAQPVSTSALTDEARARQTLARLREEYPGTTYTLARLMPVEED